MEPLEVRVLVEQSGGQWVATCPPPRMRIAEIGTDSRTLPGQSVFVALRGPKFDGHAYVEEARRRGAVASIVHRGRLGDLPPAGGPYIAVEDTLESLERLARWNREQLGVSVIGVTGSVGKTSTKEFLGTVLSGAFRARTAPKSFNNRIGVAMTLLSADSRTEVLVVELGTSAPGEIAHLSRLVRPDRVVITEIAPAHLDGLGDIRGVVEAKAEVFEGLRPGGAAFMRHGVEGFSTFLERARGPVRTFGWGAGDFAVTSSNRIALGHDARTGARCADYGYIFAINGSENFLLPVPGRHNIQNAAAAIGVARDMGMGWDEIRSSLSSCRLPPLRLQVVEAGGVVLVDDSYNANPASMEAAIAEWESLEGDSRVAVIGDMLEMGADSRRLHEQIGRRLAVAGPRCVVTVGSDSLWVGMALRAENRGTETPHFETAVGAISFLKYNLQRGDRVLFKGSRKVGLDTAVRELGQWFSRPSAESEAAEA